VNKDIRMYIDFRTIGIVRLDCCRLVQLGWGWH